MCRQSLILPFLVCCVLSCDASDSREALIGTYISSGNPKLVVELLADGNVVERINGREIRGRWGIWSTTQRGCGVTRSRIELTGLVLAPDDPQSNNRLSAHLQRWPRRLILDLDSASKLELRKTSTP
jgi:hypothetical protein